MVQALGRSGALLGAPGAVHTSLYIQTCTNEPMSLYTRTSMYLQICTGESVHKSLYIQICTCELVHTSLYIQICTYKPVHTSVYIQTCTYEPVRTSLYEPVRTYLYCMRANAHFAPLWTRKRNDNTAYTYLAMYVQG